MKAFEIKKEAVVLALYDIGKIKNNDSFFEPASARNGNYVYFQRYIGWSEEWEPFFRKIYQKTGENGAFINDGLKNPMETHVRQVDAAANLQAFTLTKEYLAKALGRLLPNCPREQQALLMEAMLEQLVALEGQGINANILKNAFVKFAGWTSRYFQQVAGKLGGEQVPKILYEGEIGKYEVYMLRILSRAGADVVYLNYESDDSYLTVDKENAYSYPIQGRKIGKPAITYTDIPPAGIETKTSNRTNTNTPINTATNTNTSRNANTSTNTKTSLKAHTGEQQPALRQNIPVPVPADAGLVVTNSWMVADPWEEIFKSKPGRGPSPTVYYNLFVRCLGYTEQTAYLAKVYRFKRKLQEANRAMVFEETKLTNPTLDEVKRVQPFPYENRQALADGLAGQMTVKGNRQLLPLLQQALRQAILAGGDAPLPKLYNYGVKLFCWFHRYGDRLFTKPVENDLPAFVYYGVCSETEARFLNMLALMPVDVMVISSDKEGAKAFAALAGEDRGKNDEMENSCPHLPFPATEPRIRAATAAYEAERQLDGILYTGTGLFRDRQFVRCNPVTLRTTYDEIAILWREEARYRPSFETGNNRVTVPNIFAKVCGVPYANTYEYFHAIEKFLTKNTILIRSLPHINGNGYNPLRGGEQKFLNGKDLLPEVIKRHRNYQYGYLSDDIQDYILEKIQQIIHLGWIQDDLPGADLVVLRTLLNMDKQTLRLIQQYDFTKEIPKVVVIHVDENMMSLEDSAYLLFLNLAGFDIVVFTPTGYRNIEKHIHKEVFEVYQVGDYRFDMRIPHLQPQPDPPPRKGGIINRLLGKG